MRYSELPKEYKDLADVRAKENEKINCNGYTFKVMIEQNHVIWGFDWEKTLEGFNWWERVNNAEDISDLPEIPYSPEEYRRILKISGNEFNPISPTHYSQFEIEPISFILANDLSFPVGNVIKYVCRYKDKGGKEDLQKAIKNIQFLIEKEYPENE